MSEPQSSIARQAASYASGSRVRARTLIPYALPAIVMGMPTIPLYVHLPAFYAETLGVGLAATGFVLLLSRLIDTVSDPLVGFFSDRYPTPFGRRKPWILVGGGVAGFAMFQLLIPPDNVDQWYLLIWSAVLYTGWTFVAVPYTAWGAELSPDYEERTRITGAREGAMMVGVIIAALLPTVFSAGEGGMKAGLEAVAWAVAAIGIPAFTLLALLVPERPEAPGSARVSFRGMATLAKNKPFMRLMSAWFVNSLANGIPAVLFTLYLDHALRADEPWNHILFLAYFLTVVVSVPLWLFLARRIDKHRVWCIAMGVACMAFIVVPFIPAGGVEAFLVVCLITGAAQGADLALPPSMQADVADLDRFRTGFDRAGQLFAFWSMATKLALGASAAIALPGVEALGFNPENVSERGILGLVLIYALVPVVLKTIAIVMVWGHPLGRRRHEIVTRALDRRIRQSTGEPT